MTFSPNAYTAPLEAALAHTRTWLASLADRPVPPQQDADAMADTLGGPLPDGPTEPAAVIDLLARCVEPGLMAMPSGRFFGWVIGGTLPAAMAADWLTSAWDQNSGMRFATPGTVAVEEAAAGWLLDLLGLPAGADVGFVTGGTMANFTGLAAGRQQVLTDHGWDLDRLGLNGAPPVRVLVGEERHGTIDLALRYLGLGAPTPVAADDQGRTRVDALAEQLSAGSGPAIVCLQAGNLHSGAFDPLREAIAVAKEHDAWVHVDGAFGLWAGASTPSSPGRRLRGRGLLGDGRPQDAERAVRLRRGHRGPAAGVACGDGNAGELPRASPGAGRPAGQGARALAARPRRSGLGRRSLTRPLRRR